jgi:hypothetical protein
MPSERARKRTQRIGFAMAVAVVLGTSMPGVAAAAIDPAVRCEYRVHQYTGGFVADVTIDNRGPAINGWTVWWTFRLPTELGVVWSAAMVQEGDEITATPLPDNRVIPTGGRLNFGWTASAPATEVPTDLTLNGRRCTENGIETGPGPW